MFSSLKKLILVGIFVALGVLGFAAAAFAGSWTQLSSTYYTTNLGGGFVGDDGYTYEYWPSPNFGYSEFTVCRYTGDVYSFGSGVTGYPNETGNCESGGVKLIESKGRLIAIEVVPCGTPTSYQILYSPTFTTLRTIISSTSKFTDIGADPNGNVYVSQGGNIYNVNLFTDTLNLVTTLGADAHFANGPGGLHAIASNGSTVWVAVDTAGSWQVVSSSSGVGSTIQSPQVDIDGSFWFTNNYNTVYHVSSAGSFIGSYAVSTSFNIPELVIDPYGRVWVKAMEQAYYRDYPEVYYLNNNTFIDSGLGNGGGVDIIRNPTTSNLDVITVDNNTTGHLYSYQWQWGSTTIPAIQATTDNSITISNINSDGVYGSLPVQYSIDNANWYNVDTTSRVSTYVVDGLRSQAQYYLRLGYYNYATNTWGYYALQDTTSAFNFAYNGSQTYWNQEVSYGTSNNLGSDYHVLVTKLDFQGGSSGQSSEYDVGTSISYSIPMQSGKYYEVQVRTISPLSTAWSPPIYVWNAPQMGDGAASIAQVTSSTATIKWPQIAPGQLMDVWWKPDSGSSWSNSGSLAGRSYQITGLSPNTKYDLCLSPYSYPNGGTGWWAGQATFYTDSAPSVDSVVIDGGATGTNVAKATVSITAHSVDYPVVAYALSNDGHTWTWYPYTAGQSQGLEGLYYANPSDTAWGQVLTDYQYVGVQSDPQVNIPGWPTNVPGFLQSADPGDSNWGAVWEGDVWISQPGSYNFAVPSDDGASLTVNGQVLVDDWQGQGQPPPGNEAGTITFSSPGWYPVTIQYFQASGGDTIQFDWEPPGASSYSLVPSVDLLAAQHALGTPGGDSIRISNIPWGLSGNGSVTVYVAVMTSDGTISAAGQGSINLLTNAQNPNLHVSLDNGASSTTDQAVAYVLTATGAGLPTEGQMQYQISGGSWSSWTAIAQTGTITLPNTPQVDTVTFQVADANGLESEASAQITLQPAPPPAQSGSSTSGKQGTYKGVTVYFTNDQTVTLAVPNPGSGTPINMQYSFDGISWSVIRPFSNSLSLTLPTGDGLKPVYVDALDANGILLSQSTTNFVLDTEEPNITELQTVSGADGTSGSSIQVMLQASENIAGALNYSINGGASQPIPTGGQVSVPITNHNGLNVITVTVSDLADNSVSKVIDIYGLAA